MQGKGDYLLYENTVHFIELLTASEIEEGGVYTKQGFKFLDGRAEKFLTIPRMD